jgi:hypothetical protein
MPVPTVWPHAIVLFTAPLCLASTNSFTSAAAVVNLTRRFCRHAAKQSSPFHLRQDCKPAIPRAVQGGPNQSIKWGQIRGPNSEAAADFAWTGLTDRIRAHVGNALTDPAGAPGEFDIIFNDSR